MCCQNLMVVIITWCPYLRLITSHKHFQEYIKLKTAHNLSTNNWDKISANYTKIHWISQQHSNYVCILKITICLAITPLSWPQSNERGHGRVFQGLVTGGWKVTSEKGRCFRRIGYISRICCIVTGTCFPFLDLLFANWACLLTVREPGVDTLAVVCCKGKWLHRRLLATGW